MQAIEEALTPRLSVTGEIGTLNKFKQFFDGKSLEKGSNILLLWKKEGVLEVVAKSHPSGEDYSQACAAVVVLAGACTHGNLMHLPELQRVFELIMLPDTLLAHNHPQSA